MKYRILGSTGLRVSTVGIGTWQFGGEWGHDFSQSEVDAVFDAAREAEINFIDTAECYGDHLSEQFTGKAIARDRDRWVVATKFGHKFHGRFDRTEPRMPRDIEQQLEDSLKALGTDVIDLYQYHSWGDSDFFNDDVLAMLEHAKQAGKVRHLGNSVGSNTNTDQVAASKRRGMETVQLIYNRLDRGPEQEVFDLCREQDLGVLARVPLASGFLSGKYDAQSTFDDTDVRSRQAAAKRRERIQQAAKIQDREVPDGVAMARWALAWCLKHPAVTCVIPGCKSPQQVQDNAAAADMAMVPSGHPQAASKA